MKMNKNANSSRQLKWFNADKPPQHTHVMQRFLVFWIPVGSGKVNGHHQLQLKPAFEERNEREFLDYIALVNYQLTTLLGLVSLSFVIPLFPFQGLVIDQLHQSCLYLTFGESDNISFQRLNGLQCIGIDDDSTCIIWLCIAIPVPTSNENRPMHVPVAQSACFNLKTFPPRSVR